MPLDLSIDNPLYVITCWSSDETCLAVTVVDGTRGPDFSRDSGFDDLFDVRLYGDAHEEAEDWERAAVDESYAALQTLVYLANLGAQTLRNGGTAQ